MTTLCQPSLDFTGRDICASRHSGSAESVAAFDRIEGAIPETRRRVLAEIRRAGASGLTAKELAALWGVGLNTISGRFTELKRDGLIVQKGARDHSGAYVANP